MQLFSVTTFITGEGLEGHEGGLSKVTFQALRVSELAAVTKSYFFQCQSFSYFSFHYRTSTVIYYLAIVIFFLARIACAWHIVRVPFTIIAFRSLRSISRMCFSYNCWCSVLLRFVLCSIVELAFTNCPAATHTSTYSVCHRITE